MKQEDVAIVERAFDSFIREYENNVNVSFMMLTDIEGLEDSDWIACVDAQREKVMLNVPLLIRDNQGKDLAEVTREALAHELIGHYGLDIFSPSDKQKLLDEVYATFQSKEPKVREAWIEVKKKYSKDFPTPKEQDTQEIQNLWAEEVFAHIAQRKETFFSKAFSKVAVTFRNLLRKVGLISKNSPLTYAELRAKATYISMSLRLGRGKHPESIKGELVSYSRAKQKIDNNQFSLFDLIPEEKPQEKPAERNIPQVDTSSAEQLGINISETPKKEEKQDAGIQRIANTAGRSQQDTEQRNNQPDSTVRSRDIGSLLVVGYVGDKQSDPVAEARKIKSSIIETLTGENPRNLHGGYGEREGEATAIAESAEVGNNQPDGDGLEFGRRTGVERPTELSNYVITDEALSTEGGAKTKYKNNIEAIKTLQAIAKEGREFATAEEKEKLVRYVGWGGMPQVFDSLNNDWQKEFAELKGTLNELDYREARRSTLDSHYTPVGVVKAMYEGLERLGVFQEDRETKVLEPSSGLGHFFGLWPQGKISEENLKFTGVELDPTTHRISTLLYPNADVLCDGFEKVIAEPETFDVVIGNPPFGQQRLFDKENKDMGKFPIHSFFVAKSIKSLKEGGIGAFVLPRNFMDSADTEVREYISSMADMVGAIRLPNGAFSKNAMTEVQTDIVFFKKNTTTPTNAEQWVGREYVSVENKIEEATYLKYRPNDRYNWRAFRESAVNQHFADNTHCVLGSMEKVIGQHGVELVVKPFEDKEFSLEKTVSELMNVSLPQNIYSTKETRSSLNSAESEQGKQYTELQFGESFTMGYYNDLKEGALFVHDAKICRKESRAWGSSEAEKAEVLELSPLMVSRTSQIIEIRDSLTALLNAEKDITSLDSDIELLRSQLNKAYDAYVSKNGFLNISSNKRLMAGDPQLSLVLSLESKFDKGLTKAQATKFGVEPKKPQAKKASIFSRRVIVPNVEVKSAETIQDAFIVTLREKGVVDIGRIGELLSKPYEDIEKELEDLNLAFVNPKSGQWEVREKYLSGDIREKIKQAQERLPENPKLERNINELKKVIPKDLEFFDISFRLGSTWIPADVYMDFIKKNLSTTPDNYWERDKLEYFPETGEWIVNIGFNSYTEKTQTWGTEDCPADRILDNLFNNKQIQVRVPAGTNDKGNTIYVVDYDKTTLAQEKADAMQEAFKKWVWDSPEVSEKLAKIYNEKFNNYVPPKYDGSHIELTNSANIELRSYQKDAIYRAISEGTALFDHTVGAGKTFTATATAVESKRMGLINKPMFVVPNHLLYQWQESFHALYPDANILVAEKEDFTKDKRELLYSRIATGDWDAVIVTHSSFRKIETPVQMEQEVIQGEIDALERMILKLEDPSNDTFNRQKVTIKRLERKKEVFEQKLNMKLEAIGKRDTAVDFEDLGVDAIFIDESQEFKNLTFTTSMNVAGLGNPSGSAKALDLYVKCRTIQKKNDGKGVYFLTGTPISNTIAEVYTLQKYLQSDLLKKMEVEHFDAWASVFGELSTDWELDSTGVNYALKTRFSKFNNLPELQGMYRTVADVVTKDDVIEKARMEGGYSIIPPIEGGMPENIVYERTDEQASYMMKIIARMEDCKKGGDAREDNPLVITNDARKAGLDYRMIDPTAEDWEGTKINGAVDKIYEKYQQWDTEKGTQLVFCDLSTPKVHSQSLAVLGENYIENPDSEKEENSDIISLDDMISKNTVFSVYTDMLEKLVEKGIPREQIAFIHDGKSDLEKQSLFRKMNEGKVRVLMGSTTKMGAGMNVQERLVALHHLDAPWRPSDLEQRNGRGIRQGNLLYAKDPENFKLSIKYYATKQTYDARMWQTIETKSLSLDQFRKGNIGERSIEDISPEAATASEMKAIATGNPLMLYQMQISTDLRKLEALEKSFYRERNSIQGTIRKLERTIEECQEYQSIHGIISEKIDSARANFPEQVFIDGKSYKIADALPRQVVEKGIRDTIEKGTKHYLCEYSGCKIACVFSSLKDTVRITVDAGGKLFSPNNLEYKLDDKVSYSGLFQRLDNFFEKDFPSYAEREEQKCLYSQDEILKLKLELEKPFERGDMLETAKENLKGVLAELEKMKEPEYKTTWEPLTVEQYKAQKNATLEAEVTPPPQTQAQPDTRRCRM